jgi:NAD-dependent dihydropyrimidine dehydrogenase PreA subunit
VIELPILDETRCTGCAECVAICPTACLEMVGAQPQLCRPLDCVACALCAAVCPTSAITISDAG